MLKISCVIVLMLQLAAGAQSTKIAFLGIWDRAVPLMERAARETGVEVTFFSKNSFTEESFSEKLKGIEVLYILNISPEHSAGVRKALEEAAEVNKKFKVIPLDRRTIHQEINRSGFFTEDPKVRTYWKANGLVNLKRLLKYTGITYFGQQGEVEPAAIIPESGLYAPELKNVEARFSDFKMKSKWVTGAPVAAFLIQQSFWITEDTKVINAQIEALRQQDINVVALFADSTAKIYEYLKEIKPDLIIEDRHGSIWEGEGGKSLLEELKAPYLRPISMLASTVEEWQQSRQGLAHRDISHFLTLQESKGTVEPIVVGGLKANVTGFRLHVPIPERVQHFAKRARKWLDLKLKENSEKKVAIIYYNKSLGKDDLMRGSPTGAFLDGPESLVRFLPKMKDAGFSLENVPDSAEKLIDKIKLRGRNIGPWAKAEMEAQADQPGTVLVSLSKYKKWYEEELKESLRKERTR